MDKEKIHIDEDFLDQSWANMSQILDKEMPVKKRKRRFIWLWFGGLMALTFMVIAYTNNPFSSELNALPIDTKEQLKTNNKAIKIADKQSIIPNSKIIEKTPVSTNKQSPETSIAINTIKKLTPSSPSEPVKPNDGSEAGTFKKDVQLSVVGSQLPSELSKTETRLTNLSTENNINGENKALTNLDLQAKNRLFIANFDPVPSLDFQPFFQQNFSVDFPIFPVKNSSNWHFGVYAGKTYSKFGSFRAGIHLQKTLSPKWSLYFGLGYAKRVAKIALNQDQSLNADAAINQLPIGSMDEEDTMAGAGTSPSPNGGLMPPETMVSNSISFRNFHYFELPVLVQYHLNSKWSLEFGGQISRLYGYRYDNPTADASTFNSSLGTINFDITRAADQSNFTIQPWEITALGGAAYQFNSKLHFYTNYRLGLNNYLTINTNPASSKKWRQIELGVRYYFK